MALFLGEYAPTLTEGSRISLPKKHRAGIRGKDVVLSKGFDGCIFVYDKSDWETLVQPRIEKRRGDGTVEEYERYLFASAVETQIDRQGRMVIPANLLDYAGIKKDTAVIGVGDHIEVWNKATWDKYIDTVTKKIRKHA